VSRLAAASVLVLAGANLIDGTGAPAVENALLVVSDGRILSVGKATPQALANLPAGARVVRAEGRWIVPGFIDAHVHAESDADLVEMLRWGVTSVRLMAEDVAASRELARRAARPESRMPDVFPAAPIFTTKGGWWDVQPDDRNLDRRPATAQAAREAVRAAKVLGSTEIKIMLDDMAWCRAPQPPLTKVRPEILTALISEARAQGMRASVHAPNLTDAKAAIDAGATALAHGVLEELDGATVAAMKSKGTFYVPTMDIFEFLADTRRFLDDVLSDPRLSQPRVGLKPEILERYRSRAYSDGYRERYPNFQNVERRLPALRENLRRLKAAGVPVALGTDMWAFPGVGVSIEMDLYVRAGWTPLEAIAAATQTAARSLAIDGERGTLEPGKRADFLVLGDDPVANVKNVRQILEIYKAGVRVGPP
jgi:imidazolonepropionase-like amidohydrolase